MKRIFLLLLVAALILSSLVGCTGKETAQDSDSVEVAEESGENETEKSSEEIPKFRIGWNNELHTGNMHLAFERPDLFENNDIHLRPISDQHLELVQGLIL